MVTTYDKNSNYFIKVTLPDPRTMRHMRLYTKQDMDAIADNILLDIDMGDNKIPMPKCMTPKGMKPLKWSKK
jgi:hypothetical protein